MENFSAAEKKFCEFFFRDQILWKLILNAKILQKKYEKIGFLRMANFLINLTRDEIFTRTGQQIKISRECKKFLILNFFKIYFSEN